MHELPSFEEMAQVEYHWACVRHDPVVYLEGKDAVTVRHPHMVASSQPGWIRGWDIARALKPFDPELKPAPVRRRRGRPEVDVDEELFVTSEN